MEHILKNYLAHPDRIVRDLFQNTDDAIAFFQAYLPERLTAILDLEKLSVLPGTYMDPKFQEHRSDILFAIPTRSGTPVQLALLFEHKIQPDRRNYFQVLRYLASIYEKQSETVLIIPFLFYHNDRGFIPDSFAGLFQLSGEEEEILHPYIPDFAPELFYLSKSNTEKVRFSLHLYAFLSTIRYADLSQLADRWDEILECTARVFQGQKGVEELMKLVVYVLKRTDVPVENIKKPVFRISGALENLMITTAERLKEEGRQEVLSTAERLKEEGRQEALALAERLKEEGRQEALALAERLKEEGRQETLALAERLKEEGKLEDARNLLELGVSLDIVLRATGLTLERLKKAGILSE